jgi:hypothetical protein
MTRRPVRPGPPTAFAGTRPSVGAERFRRCASWSQRYEHQRETHGKAKARASIPRKTALRFSVHLSPPIESFEQSPSAQPSPIPPGWPCDRDLRAHRQRRLYSDNRAQVNSPGNPNLRTLRSNFALSGPGVGRSEAVSARSGGERVNRGRGRPDATALHPREHLGLLHAKRWAA